MPRSSSGGKKAKRATKKPKVVLPDTKPEARSLADLDVPRMNRDQVLEFINEQAGAEVIQMADRSGNPFLLRRPFHIASIDSQTFGGMPSGGTTQIDGPDGVGKNSMCWQTVATCQKIYGDRSSIAWCWLEVPADKGHARINGARVPWSDDELMLEDQRRFVSSQPTLTSEEIADLKWCPGDFYMVDSGSAEARLEAVTQLVAANCCQLIIVDSVSSATSHYRMNTSLEEEPRQSATAWMLSEFQKKCWGYFSSPHRGRFNFTSLIIIGQVRSEQGQRGQRGKKGGYQKEYSTKGPYALRHAKLLNLTLSYGAKIPERRPYRGKWVPWEVTKAKAGSHEGFRGQVPYYYDTGFDIHQDLVSSASDLNLIVTRGGGGCDLVDDTGEVILQKAPWGTAGADLMQMLRELYSGADAMDGPWGRLYRAVLNSRGASCLHRL